MVTDADRADVIFALERAARPYGDCSIGLPGLLCKARDLIKEQVALLAEAEAIIKHREAAERAERERIIRALGIYPEWCDGWGLTKNLNMAVRVAAECARMVRVLPDDLPADDEDAGAKIAKAIRAIPVSDQERAMSEELKPCPFCGGKASADGRIRFARSETWWPGGIPVTEAFYVNCIQCGTAARPGIVGGHQTRAEAITAWNTRAEEPGPPR